MNIIMAATFFLLIGVILTMKLWFIKIPLVVMGIALITSRDRLAIDFENRRIMKYALILGYRWGKWLPADRAKYISLVRIRMHRNENFISITRHSTKAMVKANLIFSKKHYVTLFREKGDNALEMVKTIALGFDLKILDMTGKGKQWIEPNILHGSFDGTETMWE